MTDRLLAFLFLVAIVACGFGCASHRSVGPAAGARPKHYLCSRAGGAIEIDGRLDDAAWAKAPWSEAFVDIQGSIMPPPRFETRMKMLWDDEYLYIAAWLDEPHVWGTLTEYDQIVFYDNDFEIFIDPNGDTNEYYEIEINALNTIFDLFLVRTYINGGPALHDWDLKGMIHAVHLDGTLNDPIDTDRGWSVEFALPWTGLAPAAHMPTPPNDGDVWRINFSRVEWHHHVVNGRYESSGNTAWLTGSMRRFPTRPRTTGSGRPRA